MFYNIGIAEIVLAKIRILLAMVIQIMSHDIAMRDLDIIGNTKSEVDRKRGLLASMLKLPRPRVRV